MTKRRLISYIIYGSIFLAFFIVPGLLRLLTDWYWFGEIGFSNIFITIFGAKIFLGLGVGALTFFIIYGNLLLARRLVASKPLIIRLTKGEADQVRELDVGKYVNRLILPISLLFGFLTGLAGAGSWETVLKYFNAVPFGTVDPIFGRDIAFYFFDLPFIQFLIGMGFWIIGVSLIGIVVSYTLRGAITLRQPVSGLLAGKAGAGILKSLFIEKVAKTHISILVALLFVLISVKIYAVRIPSLLYGSTGQFTGVSFTDIHAVLPFLKILIFCSYGRSRADGDKYF